MSPTTFPETATINTGQLRFMSGMTDVLIYTVVLNLFVEYVDAIVIDSFTISVLTAVLLAVMLGAIVRIEHRVGEWFDERGGTLNRVLGFLAAWGILFGSKFVILEVVDLIFGEHVELGHLLDVIVLVIAMMLTRQLATVMYRRLGDPTE